MDDKHCYHSCFSHKLRSKLRRNGTPRKEREVVEEAWYCGFVVVVWHAARPRVDRYDACVARDWFLRAQTAPVARFGSFMELFALALPFAQWCTRASDPLSAFALPLTSSETSLSNFEKNSIHCRVSPHLAIIVAIARFTRVSHRLVAFHAKMSDVADTRLLQCHCCAPLPIHRRISQKWRKLAGSGETHTFVWSSTSTWCDAEFAQNCKLNATRVLFHLRQVSYLRYRRLQPKWPDSALRVTLRC